MKIDTPEKLAILLFGINVGKVLGLDVERINKSYIKIGDFENASFWIDSDGDIFINSIDSSKDHFSVLGAKVDAESNALEYWRKINGGAE